MYWHRHHVFLLQDDILKEALAVGVKRNDLVVGSRAAMGYSWAINVRLTALAFVLMRLVIRIAPAGLSSQEWHHSLELLATKGSLINFAVVVLLARSWKKARRDRERSVGRLAFLVVSAMNALQFDLADPEPQHGDDRPGRNPITWASVINESREKLRTTAYAIAVEQAMLAGWSSDDYCDERWSRLGRVLVWTARSPYDKRVRAVMLRACSMCLGKASDEHMLDPLDITVPDIYLADLEMVKKAQFSVRALLSRIVPTENRKAAVLGAVVAGLVTIAVSKLATLGWLLGSLPSWLIKVISSGQWSHLWELLRKLWG
jgi:hypothetical protein